MWKPIASSLDCRVAIDASSEASCRDEVFGVCMGGAGSQT